MAVTEDMLKATLLGAEDPVIRVAFTERYSGELEEFIRRMVVAFEGWEHLDQTLCTNQDEAGATVSALLYGAMNSHVVAMKLLIAGLLVCWFHQGIHSDIALNALPCRSCVRSRMWVY